MSFRGADGKRKIRYCRTKEDAETLFAQWRTEIRQGRYRNQVERREPGAVLTFRAVRTFGELCDVYAKHRAALVRDGEIRPHVLMDETGCMEIYLRPYFAHRKVSEITLEDIEDFRERLATDVPALIVEVRAQRYATVYGGKVEDWRTRQSGKPIGPRTIAKALAIVTSMLEKAREHNVVGQNVGAQVRKRRPKLHALDPAHVLTEREAQSLVERADGQLRLMVLFALRTGARQGEQLALTWGDIDLQAKRIHIRRSLSDGKPGPTKNQHSKRIIPMDDTLLPELRRWRLASPKVDGDIVFPADRGGYYCPSVLTKRFRALRDSCGFERPELSEFTWHDMRHNLVSHALAAGVPLLEVSRLAGHSSMHTTSTVYAHYLPDREDSLREALSKLALGRSVSSR